MRDVVVTGVGLVTGLGVGTRESWEGMLAGRSAIRRLTNFDPKDLRTQQGAEIDGFRARDFADRRALRMMTREDQLAIAGATLAVEDSGLDPATVDKDHLGLYLGGNKEVSDPGRIQDGVIAARGPDGVASIERFVAAGMDKVFPLFYIEGLQGAALFYISAKYGLRGPNCYFHGSADAGATAVGRAARAVRRGDADAAIAGGYDAPVWWWPMSRIDGLGVLSDRNEDGPAAFRPFDRDRSGSILGEGAAFLVLESAAHARGRGADPYCTIAGWGGGHDVGDPLSPDPDGRGLVNAIRRALEDAGTDVVDYVATHGSGTRLGDPSETVALHRAFGDAAHRLACSSVKPAAGHLMAGAGALNAAVAALAVRHGAVPPTLNLVQPDPACDLDYVPGDAREMRVDTALALARGMEGQNVALVMRR